MTKGSSVWTPRDPIGAARVLALGAGLNIAASAWNAALSRDLAGTAVARAAILAGAALFALSLARRVPGWTWLALAAAGPVVNAGLSLGPQHAYDGMLWSTFWVVYSAAQFRGRAAWTLLLVNVPAAVLQALFDTTGEILRVLPLVVSVAILTTGALVQSGNRQDELMDGLRRRADHDPLTGLVTRRVLSDAVDAARDEPCGLILLDIDHFKSINDDLGHPEGDRVLASVGRALGSITYSPDVASRLGGDEFALLVHGTRATVAQHALLVREAIGAYATAPSTITASIGWVYGAGHGFSDTYLKADRALYTAKRTARGSIVSFGSIEGA